MKLQTAAFLSLQYEIHSDLCFHLHRFAVQVVGPVLPLPDSIKSGARQQRMSADQFGSSIAPDRLMKALIITDP